LDVFVLVPGAWHGAWCWEATIAALRRRGHEAYAPELRGLGGDGAEPSDVGLDTHVADLERFIVERDLMDVTLVGVNAGAALLPMVFERVPVCIDGVIFIDGLIPLPGESVVEVAERYLPGSREAWDRAAATTGYAALPPDPKLLGWMLADVPEPLKSESLAKMRPHPYRTLTEPVQYRSFPSAPPFRAYIRCQRTPLTNPGWSMARRADADLYPLGASHDAMLSHPEGLADRLLEIVATWNAGDVPERVVG
jgi:pimeloyl-ACP methyl ester carboxylesterase